MTAAESFTYEQSPPFRPSLEDLGGADYEDDAAFPPDPTTMPNAREHCERARNQSALNRVNPVALIHVAFAAGAPSVQAIYTVRTDLESGDVTVTDNGAGDTSLTFPANTFPTPIVPPMATIAEDLDATVCAYGITSGVRVKTRARSDGTGTDAAFVVAIY